MIGNGSSQVVSMDYSFPSFAFLLDQSWRGKKSRQKYKHRYYVTRCSQYHYLNPQHSFDSLTCKIMETYILTDHGDIKENQENETDAINLIYKELWPTKVYIQGAQAKHTWQYDSFLCVGSMILAIIMWLVFLWWRWPCGPTFNKSLPLWSQWLIMLGWWFWEFVSYWCHNHFWNCYYLVFQLFSSLFFLLWTSFSCSEIA